MTPVPEATRPSTPVETFLERYGRYLLERGLAPGTVRGYVDVARLFLESLPPVTGLGLRELTASGVIEFVTVECRHRSVGSAAGSETVTTQLALSWATLPAEAKQSWHAGRLSVVRGFARYLALRDERTEVPPPDLLTNRSHRACPYLYSTETQSAATR